MKIQKYNTQYACLKNITIIGGGAAGIIAAANIITIFGANTPNIFIFDDKIHQYGIGGFPYNYRHNNFMLNTPNNVIGLVERDEFINYKQKKHADHIDPHAFSKRGEIGDFLEYRLNELDNKIRGYNNNLFIFNNLIVDVEYDSNDFTITTEDGNQFQSIAVILATGNTTPQDHWNISKYPNYIECYNFDKLDLIDTEADITIVGSGLSAIDMILYLSDKNHTGKIYNISRNTQYPMTQADKYVDYKLQYCTLDAFDDTVDFDTLYATALKEIKYATSIDVPWQSVINKMRCITDDIFQKLSYADRVKFWTEYSSIVSRLIHRITPNEMQKLGKLLPKICILDGLSDINYHDNKFEVSCKPKKASIQLAEYTFPISQQKKVICDIIINCTGPIRDPYHWNEKPLTSNLLRRGLISPNPKEIGGGINVDRNFSSIDQDYTPIPKLKALGPIVLKLVSGNAMHRIAANANRAITHLFEILF